MSRRILLFLLCCLPGLLSAQNLTVRDRYTRAPLEAVAVFADSAGRFTTTDSRGRTDISAFAGAEDIVIRLLGYRTEIFSFDQLKERQFRVFLEPEDFALDEVVVSATRWQQNKRDLPSRITAIGKKEILLENPLTAADLLSISGEVFIQKSQLGGGSPMIRGFATNRVLITIDGVRMNNAIFRSGNIQNVISLDPLSIEKTEILFGPGAVMYGSDALGGAMNFYTLTARLHPEGKSGFSGNAFFRHSTAYTEKTGHLDLQAGIGKWAFLTSASYNDFADLKSGKFGPDEFLRSEYAARLNNRDTVLFNPDPRQQTPSGYNQWNLLQKIRFSPKENMDIQYGFHYSATSDVPRFDRLIEYNSTGSLRDAEWYYGPQVWMMNVLNLSMEDDNMFPNKLRMVLAWQRFEESRHNRNFGSNIKNHRTEKVDAWSLNLDVEKKLDERNSMFYGAEMILNRVGSEAYRENIITSVISPLSTRYPDESSWRSAAVYVNHLARLSKKATLQSGLRYSRTGLHADFDTSFYPFPFVRMELSNGALTGSTGLAYRPSEVWQINSNLSTGYRSPNIDDAGKVFDSEPGSVMVPNPELKPEYAWNLDLGITRIFSNKAKIDLGVYYTWLNDALVRRDFLFNGRDSIDYDGQLSRVLAIQNAASARVMGIQAAAEIKFSPEFVLLSRLTWQHGEEELDDGTTAPLRHAVPWFGLTRISFTKSRTRTELIAHYQGRITFSQLPPSEASKPHLYALDEEGNPWSPGWISLNVKFLYQISDAVAFTAGLENMTNALYRPYSSGISAPGRNLILAIRASF
jgi:hemoglobin/transferrin/lactoferrin receptor protein